VFGLLMRDFGASRAFRLSFLASIPAVLGANLGLQLIEGFPDVSVASASAGVATSFVVGYASIGVLLDVAERFPMYMVAFVLGLLALLPLLL
jgi:undecaprenyl-diphosphatase